MFWPAKRQVWMVICMVTDFVSFVHNPANKRRVTFRVHTDDEERGFYVRGFQNVQNLWGPSRIGTVIKCEGDLMLATCALVVQRRKLGELHIFRRDIAL